MQAGISKTTNCMCYMCLPDSSSPSPQLPNPWVIAFSPSYRVNYFITALFITSNVPTQQNEFHFIWATVITCITLLCTPELLRVSCADPHVCLPEEGFGTISLVSEYTWESCDKLQAGILIGLPIIQVSQFSTIKKLLKRHQSRFQAGTRGSLAQISHDCWFHPILSGSIPFLLVLSHSSWFHPMPAGPSSACW